MYDADWYFLSIVSFLHGHCTAGVGGCNRGRSNYFCTSSCQRDPRQIHQGIPQLSRLTFCGGVTIESGYTSRLLTNLLLKGISLCSRPGWDFSSKQITSPAQQHFNNCTHQTYFKRINSKLYSTAQLFVKAMKLQPFFPI